MESKGTVYFEDGSTEAINYYWKESDNYVEFYTNSGKYAYARTIVGEQIDDDRLRFKRSKYIFVKCGIRVSSDFSMCLSEVQIEQLYSPAPIKAIEIWDKWGE